MSTKKQGTWMDHLGESSLPSDNFTWTEASNYGLDGFHYDQTLGEGTRKNPDTSGLAGPITQSTNTGMSALPDGLVSPGKAAVEYPEFTDMDGGLNLGDMLSEEEGSLHMTAAEKQAASLADLAWLDPTQEQDPARLPKELRPDQPPLNSIPELEEAWGVDRRTDGLRLLPNKDKAIADYEKSIESGLPATPGVEKNASDILWHINKAIRLSHYGADIRSIQAYLHQNLPTPMAKKAFKQVAADHGVAGRVYIRASAFPGLKNGKWAKEIKRRCRTAKFVLTNDMRAAAKLGLPAVNDINWKRALHSFRPLLKAAGYEVATLETPKRTLQLAFLTGPKQAEHVPSTKPVDVRPADTVSAKEAREAFAKAPKQDRLVISKDETAPKRAKVLASLHRARKAGLLSDEEVLKLSQSKASPTEINNTAQRLARINLASKNGTYSGVGTRVTEYRQQRDAEWAKLAQAEVDSSNVRKAQRHIAKMVKAGQITKKEAAVSLRQGSPEEMLRYATAYANNSGNRKVKMAASEPAKQYDGAVRVAALQQIPEFKKLSAYDQRLHEASAVSGIKVAEFRALASWTRRQMSEGMAGSDLTALIKHRFASPLRKAAKSIIAALREEHEGLSGHLYVDAGAYASKTGTKGCEKAAPTHRANQIPFVKSMDRCAGCVFANANGNCNKYGKTLMAELPENAADFKQQMIATADAPDHEITASLFDPGEFNLGTQMDGLDLSDPKITEDLGDVLFGDGMTL